MYATTSNHGTGWKALLLSLALGLLLAGPAIAKSTSGEAVLEAKDSEAMTLQLVTMKLEEVLIQVTDDTRIYDGDDKRISFAQIPDPSQVTTTVEYTGSMTAQGLIATRLVVQAMPN